MERLYASWRHAYVTRGAEHHGCVFCDAQASAEAAPLIVHQGETAFVILNLFPYNSGHLLVVPRRHLASTTALTRAELIELAVLTQTSEQVLADVYQPQGVNIGMNLGRSAGAGVADHIHTHLVPRWTGDTSFMTVVGQVRVLPEEVSKTAERLRPVFARLLTKG